MLFTRFLSTKRSIPYITKGLWKLPETHPPPNAKLETKASPTIKDSKTGTNIPKDWRKLKNLEQWKRKKFALQEKFPEGWNPPKKLDRNQINRMREIKQSNPKISLDVLAEMFKVSPEACRRIVRTKWKPQGKEEEEKTALKWARRKERIKPILLEKRAKLGQRPKPKTFVSSDEMFF